MAGFAARRTPIGVEIIPDLFSRIPFTLSVRTASSDDSPVSLFIPIIPSAAETSQFLGSSEDIFREKTSPQTRIHFPLANRLRL